MKPTLDDYYKDIPISELESLKDNVFSNHSYLTDMMIEASCIIDFQKRRFHDIGKHGLFLNGFSLETAKKMGYEFFNEIIHPDDIYLWAEMHHTILKYLDDNDSAEEDVHFFSCTFRIKSCLQTNKSPDYLMIYLKLKPVWIKCQLKYGLCLFNSSVIKTSGNLCVHFKDKKPTAIIRFD